MAISHRVGFISSAQSLLLLGEQKQRTPPNGYGKLSKHSKHTEEVGVGSRIHGPCVLPAVLLKLPRDLL